jgi:hypothetical protein
MTLKKFFKKTVHIIFISQILYAVYFYITSPKATKMVDRRLWALEAWFSILLYGIFLWLFIFTEKKGDEDFKDIFIARNKIIFAYIGLVIAIVINFIIHATE